MTAEDTYIDYIRNPSDYVQYKHVTEVALKPMCINYINQMMKRDELERSSVRMSDLGHTLVRITDYKLGINSRTKTLSALLFIGTNAFHDSIDGNLWEEFEEQVNKQDITYLIKDNMLLTDNQKYIDFVSASRSLSVMSEICDNLQVKVFSMPNLHEHINNYYRDEYVGQTFDILKDRFGMKQISITDILLVFALYNTDIINSLGESHSKKVDIHIKNISDMFQKVIENYMMTTV